MNPVTADRVEAWQNARVRQWRDFVAANEDLKVHQVTCRLVGAGCTVDDPVHERRFVFNKHGELIATRSKRTATTHPWQEGVRWRVDVA